MTCKKCDHDKLELIGNIEDDEGYENFYCKCGNLLKYDDLVTDKVTNFFRDLIWIFITPNSWKKGWQYKCVNCGNIYLEKYDKKKEW